MVNKQTSVLQWVFENRDNFPLKSGKVFQAYQETESYQKTQQGFSELLSKLTDKGYLEKPEYATYDISEKGINRIKTLRDQTLEVNRPNDFEELVEELVYFLHQNKENELNEASVRGREFELSLSELQSFNPEILESETFRSVDYLRDAIDEAVDEVLVLGQDESVEVRIVPDVEFLDTDLRTVISRGSTGELTVVEGMLKKSERVSKLTVSATFQCTTCGEVVEKDQDSPKLKSPFKCEACGSKTFEVKEKNYTDVMDFELSQRDEKETALEARITGKLGPKHQKALMTGNRIRVLGVPKVRTDNKKEKQTVYLDVVDYQRVDVKKDLEDFDRDKRQDVLDRIKASDTPFQDFYRSIAPHVGGMELPKKAIAVSLIGCPRFERMNEDGRIHTGIITNPGLGKSKLQNWVNDSFGKTQIADGPSSTSAGLTATVEQNQGNQWQVVAGKLVFAHKGILQLDEFDKYPEGELTSLNSAMEDGEFKLSKASVQASLPGEATVIATGNFSRELDDHTEAYEILPDKGIGLYDRFSLLVGVQDQGSEPVNKITEGFTRGGTKAFEAEYSVKELRIFRHIVRDKKVYLSDEAADVLQTFHNASTDKEKSDVRGTSNRDYVHLVKLTLALARCNLRDEATAGDARKATKLVREARESLDLGMGEKASDKARESVRLNDFEDAFSDLKEQGQKVDLTDLEDKFTSSYGHDSSEFEQALEIKKKSEYMVSGNTIEQL